tara:strand:+ start:635 stop:859 length:225 start_codon:yes stop_codon:yes gene_type:complete
MTEDLRQKEIRLRKELAQIKGINSNVDSKLRKTRDFSVGVPKDTTHKAKPVSSDVPDVVTLPPKHRNKKENIPF